VRRLASAAARDLGRLAASLLPSGTRAALRARASHRGCGFRAWACRDGWYCGACRGSWGPDGRPDGRWRACCASKEDGHHEPDCVERRNALHFACHAPGGWSAEGACAWEGCPLGGGADPAGPLFPCFLRPLPACGEPGCTEAHP
jgi:hypothetical protein